MKRKSLLMMLLVALFVPLAMDAQTRTAKMSVVGSVELEMTASAKEMSSFPLLTKVESLREAALEEINGRGVRADNELLTEGFESMSSISTSYSSTGWYAYNAGSGNNWTLNSSSSYANNSSKSAQVEYSSRYAANCYLVSAPFTVSSSMSELTVSLYERVRSSSYAETFEVFFVKASDVTTLNGVASATKYNAIASASYTNTTYAQQSGTVTNSALAGQSVRVVVHCTSAADMYYLNIDDITVTETAEETCPKPTDLNVTNITNNSAHLGWNGEAEGYSVRYRTAGYEETIFSDDFESGLGNWTIYTDGDYLSDYFDEGWFAYTASSLNQTAHGGTVCAFSCSWYSSTALSADNWLITPQVALKGTLKFWVRSNYSDEYEVKLSTTGNAESNFTVTLKTLAAAPSSWTLVSLDLNSYNGQPGYIAIHHNFTDGQWLCVDDFSITESVEAGPWMPNEDGTSSSTNSFDLTGLDSETIYEWQVMANCEDGDSNWSSSSTFTTLSTCETPTGLSSADITNNSAALSWTGYTDAYNIQYREYDATAPATIILNVGDVWGDGSGYQMLIDADATAYDGGTISDYSIFEYKIPTNADYNTNTSNMVVNNSVSIQIPAGTYDWFITNPTPDDAIYIAGSNGNVGGRQDNYVFEAGLTYEFVPSRYGTGDGIDVTITGNWTPVSGTVTSPYTLTGLDPETTYAWQVKGDGCDNWSASNIFTTLNGILVESITADDVEVVVGATANITNLVVLPDDATNPAVTYTSNDETIATVNDNGVVTGVAVGTTTITIAATDGSGVTATINVTVNGIDVTGITAENVTVVNGETATISYTVAPENATDPSVTITSADPTIATVDENGVVTGVSVGETTITITSVSNPEVTATINVTVTSNPNAVQFTVNAPANAQPGDVITVECVLNAPTEGTYNGFTGLVVGLHFDPTVFAVNGNPVKGPVADAGNMATYSLPNETHPETVNYSVVMTPGNPNTTTGIVYTAQFTVLTEAELGSYTFYVEPTAANQFVYNPGSGATPIPYEYVPSTVTIAVPEQYTLHITGYTNNGGYYLIASPIGTVNPTEVTNMITENDADNNRTYDLYRFQQDPSDNLEWRNYRQGAFDLEVGKGYLYAHRTDVDLVFTGSAISESTYEVPLTKVEASAGLEFPDWNLVGNPFADIAHIDGGHAFYTLDVSGKYTLVSDASSTIESMQGVFVVAGENEDHITFVKGEPSAKSPKVTLNVGKGTEPGVIDRAIVCFGETRQMPKFQFDRNSTKVYIPMEGKEYALVRGEEMGELPVNFKAEENGTYSMNFSCENVGFAYLHLIDNKTGNDVDLLQTPSYSFEAKTTDYESRFKLVFATGDNSNDDNFAFFSNGSFVINNDGTADLQVIDLMGRILSSETINGCTNVNVNAAPGVYMLRLINGDNVKVQKVVVK